MKRREIVSFASIEARHLLRLHAHAVTVWTQATCGDVDEEDRQAVLDVIARMYELVESIPGNGNAAGKKAN